MNKKRLVRKITYIGLSVSLASLLIFTAVPYYLLSTLSYGNFEIFFHMLMCNVGHIFCLQSHHSYRH